MRIVGVDPSVSPIDRTNAPCKVWVFIASANRNGGILHGARSWTA
jgi:hypothetical protein